MGDETYDVFAVARSRLDAITAAEQDALKRKLKYGNEEALAPSKSEYVTARRRDDRALILDMLAHTCGLCKQTLRPRQLIIMRRAKIITVRIPEADVLRATVQRGLFLICYTCKREHLSHIEADRVRTFPRDID